MPRHEFGAMDIAPKKGVRYDEYEPQKYNCITVDDMYIEGILDKLNNIHTYAHTLDVPYSGLAYCGVTLIPPEVHGDFINVISDVSELGKLTELFRSAICENKFIIHYGL